MVSVVKTHGSISSLFQLLLVRMKEKNILFARKWMKYVSVFGNGSERPYVGAVFAVLLDVQQNYWTPDSKIC